MITIHDHFNISVFQVTRIWLFISSMFIIIGDFSTVLYTHFYNFSLGQTPTTELIIKQLYCSYVPSR